jgi:hypothetical protein
MQNKQSTLTKGLKKSVFLCPLKQSPKYVRGLKEVIHYDYSFESRNTIWQETFVPGC